jgi:hypothetical protein
MRDRHDTYPADFQKALNIWCSMKFRARRCHYHRHYVIAYQKCAAIDQAEGKVGFAGCRWAQ